MDMQNISRHLKRNLLNFSHYHKVELAVLFLDGFGCPSLPDDYIMLITFLKEEDGIVRENDVSQSPHLFFNYIQIFLDIESHSRGMQSVFVNYWNKDKGKWLRYFANNRQSHQKDCTMMFCFSVRNEKFITGYNKCPSNFMFFLCNSECQDLMFP